MPPLASMSPRQAGSGLVPSLDDPAVLHPHDPPGGVGDRLVVGDQQDRLTASVKAAEQLEHLLAALAVEGAGRFVGEHDRGLVGERPGDGQTLALSAGQHARGLPRLVADAEQIEQVTSMRLGGTPLASGDHRRHHDVLQRRHPLEQVEELEHDADVLAPHDRQAALIHAGERLPGDHDLALVGHIESGDDVQQGRLATARRSHHGDELPAGRSAGRLRAGRAPARCPARTCGTPSAPRRRVRVTSSAAPISSVAVIVMPADSSRVRVRCDRRQRGCLDP